MPLAIDIRTRRIASIFLLFLFVLLAYSQAITFDWVHYDDDAYVLKNPIIGLPTFQAIQAAFARGYFNSYIPLTLVSHAVDLKLWGPAPAGHHLTNVLLHSLNAVWVLLLALVILQGVQPKEARSAGRAIVADARSEDLSCAMLAALLFALHPLRAESVGWISDRKDLLAAAFALPAAVLYLRERFHHRSRRLSFRMVLSLLLFALGALSKTATVALAGVFVLFELTVGEGGKERLRGILQTVPFLFVGLGVSGLAIGAAPTTPFGYGVEQLSPAMRSLLPGYSILFYVGKMVFPFPLVPVYMAPAPLTVLWTGLGAVLAAALLVYAYARGHRALAVAFAAYAILLLPTMTGLSAGIQPWSDRYSYLATVPVVLVGSFGIGSLAVRQKVGRRRVPRWLFGFGAASLIAASAVLTVCQTRIWYDALSLWSHQLAHGPRVSLALNNMGTALVDAGRRREARAMFDEALQTDSHSLTAMFNLRRVAEDHADSVRIIALYEDVVRQVPGDARFHQALGEMYWGQGKEESSVVEFRRAVEIDPGAGGALHDLAIWHLQYGRKDSAKTYLRRAVDRMPGFGPPYYVLGVLSLAERDTTEGVRQIAIAARLGFSPAKQLLRSLSKTW